MADPLHQFEIQPIVPIQIGGLDLSFSNSAAFMVAAVLATTTLLMFGMRGRAIVPGRLQSMAELLYEFIAGMVKENAGPEARRYFPLVFSIFTFILFGNLLGMIPGAFTFTSHIAVTFALAMVVFLFVTILALVRHGLHFFSFFMPQGAPIWLAPLIVPIEIVSYLSRPVSLSIRLFANMMAGHTMLKVFAGFTVSMGAALGGLGYAFGLIPVLLNVALIGFEILVAFMQAYVFTILTCIYIRDAIELH
ncbi:F0F1 ATP synthase subunit A [Rhodospirillum centenum]|uniref:ATP synthase subunit a n=1 Tax=Rhodospirillum centenum (strain ATCC 51521 / SW) TaxID=414684 RepID=B6IX44_RHOCS|nr:F0F1 ATP synthase subunit A [Rhodospirillum centenum]ACJ00868.1 ATP synthase F0, A subunit [Rhodospirillum centenum SW]